MAEVVHVFENDMVFDGARYRAQVTGRPDGHIWEGWIEFVAFDGDDRLRTPRETTQPDRAALVYWATGLSATYLEGALRRALAPPLVRHVAVPPPPAFEAPAPTMLSDMYATDRAVLDPFSVGAKGETLLRQELGALRAWHLRNIVRAYRLASEDVDLEMLSAPELIERIVAGVRSAQSTGV